MSMRTISPQYLCWPAAGFAVWGSALVALYAIHGLGCAFAWPAGPVRTVLVLVLMAHLAVIALMWRHLASASQSPDATATGEFMHTVAVWSVIAAFVTMLLTLAPPLVLTGCT
jgi:hypothetical protein